MRRKCLRFYKKPEIYELDNRDVVKYLGAVKQGKFNYLLNIIKIKRNYFLLLGLKEIGTGVLRGRGS